MNHAPLLNQVNGIFYTSIERTISVPPAQHVMAPVKLNVRNVTVKHRYLVESVVHQVNCNVLNVRKLDLLFTAMYATAKVPFLTHLKHVIDAQVKASTFGATPVTDVVEPENTQTHQLIVLPAMAPGNIEVRQNVEIVVEQGFTVLPGLESVITAMEGQKRNVKNVMVLVSLLAINV